MQGLLKMKCKSGVFFIFCFVVTYLLYGCTAFIKPPAEPSLEKLSYEQLESYPWSDDLEYDGIERAVEQSVSYYRRLPPDRSFRYGDMLYSPEEMVASLELFLETIHNHSGIDLDEQIREKFNIFESRNGDGGAFFTGYYEPVLEGSSMPTDDFNEPVYEVPDDLVQVNLSSFSEKWNNEQIVGRVDGKYLIPYDSREEIVYEKSLEDRAKPIAYVKEIELFFLQIQGSGLINLDDGTTIRVNYAQRNGHPYRAVGRVLTDRIPLEDISLQSIKAYLYNNPDEVRDILNYNQSYTFFRIVNEGPLGDIEVPLTPYRSIAMDKRAAPRGGLAFIRTELPMFENNEITDWESVNRFVLVQDTGGAIRDHGRVDIFFGHDEDAELTAGHLKQKGRVFLIVARKEYLGKGDMVVRSRIKDIDSSN